MRLLKLFDKIGQNKHLVINPVAFDFKHDLNEIYQVNISK